MKNDTYSFDTLTEVNRALCKLGFEETDFHIRDLLQKGDLHSLGAVMQIGDFFMRRGDHTEALVWYRHVSVSIQPEYPCAYLNQARCLSSLSKYLQARELLDQSLHKVNFSHSVYSFDEILSYLQIYCLILLKFERNCSVHPAFSILSSVLERMDREGCSSGSLYESCKALALLETAEPNPVPKDSEQILLERISSFASSPNNSDKIILSRPGNVEVVAVLTGGYTWNLGNNAGIYPSKDEDASRREQSFARWKDLYTQAMAISDHVMIANFLHNYSGPYLSTLGIRNRAVNYPYHSFWCTALSLLLEGKKVLCISPFAKTMKDQSRFLDKIHGNRWQFNVENLLFYKCPQSIAFSSFKGWEQNFEIMTRDLESFDFDIAFISAGGYGHPLITYLSSKGKSAIYCGALLQAVFGITGQRFDVDLKKHVNGYWKRPSWDETPVGYTEVEGGCYW